MAWTPAGNLRGPKGDKGDPGDSGAGLLTPQDDWIGAIEAGGYVLLGVGVFDASSVVDLPENVTVDGCGPGLTVIRLPNGANRDVFRSVGFASKTGTDVGGGPAGITLRGFGVDGNRANNTSGRGIVLYAPQFVMKDVITHHCAGDGIWSEWADIGDQAELPHAMESYAENVRSHHNGGLGFNVQGPHDGFWQECVAYHNDGGGFRAWRNAHGTLFRTCHSWGAQAFGVSIEQNGVQWEHSDAEVASDNVGVACLIVAANDVRVSGKVWSPGPTVDPGSYGIQVGLPGKPASNLHADVHLTGTGSGAVRFVNTGGMNVIKAHTWLTTGRVIAGTPHVSDVVDIPSPGGLRPDYTLIDNGELVRDVIGTNYIRHRNKLPDPGGSATWYKLGTWRAAGSGQRMEIEVVGSSGYDATPNTVGRMSAVLSTGNGGVSPNIVGYFRGEGTGVAAVTDIRAVANGHAGNGATWDIYGSVAAYTGNSYISVEVGNDTEVSTWEWAMTPAADPGWISSTVQVLTPFNQLAEYTAQGTGSGTLVGTLAMRDKWGAVGGQVPVYNGPPPAPYVPPGPVALTDAVTIATNAAAGNLFRVTLAGNRTLGAPTNPTDGQKVLWQVTASGADRTLTLATGAAGSFKFGADITSVPAIASGTTAYIGAVYNQAAARWHVLAVGKGF